MKGLVRSRPRMETLVCRRSRKHPWTSAANLRQDESMWPVWTAGAPYISELGQPVPLPFIHFPFGVPSYCLSSYVPCPNVMLSVPWLPPVPAGLCEDGLQGPLILPQIQQGAVHHSPPPEPGPPAESRKVFFTLQPPPLQEELMPVKHPQPPAKHEETNIAELD
uniref:uncharacterized protein LOC109958588 isoform X2 n=1 Tax=Monopterus albus TaxID=43700 RepID=UPI0009B3419A|nr:uncharacterized protein LOC109958588 isoform X2 [Monopterus albus]